MQIIPSQNPFDFDEWFCKDLDTRNSRHVEGIIDTQRRSVY